MSEHDSGTRLQSPFTPHTDRVSCVALSPDTSWVASGSFDGRVLLWHVDDGKVFGGIAMPPNDVGRRLNVSAMSVAKTVNVLAIGGEDGMVRLWNTDTWTPKAAYQGHTRDILALAFNPASDKLVSSALDYTVLLRAADGSFEHRLATPRLKLCRSAAFSPNGKVVAVGADDGTVRIFDASAGSLLGTIDAHSAEVSGLAFAGKDDCLVSGSWDGSVKWWDLKTSALLAEHSRHSGKVTSISAGLGVIASGSEDGTVDIADAETAEQIVRLEDNAYWVHCTAVAHDQPLVVAGAQDSAVRLWSYSPSKLFWNSLNSERLAPAAPSSAKQRKNTRAVDPAELYRAGDIVTTHYSFTGVRVLSIQAKGRGTTKAIEVVADQPPRAASPKGKRPSKTGSPSAQLALGKLGRFRPDREVTVLATTTDGVLEEGRVEGNWEGREFSLDYRIHWEPGTVEALEMTVHDVVQMLEKKALADLNGDDFSGLSAYDLRNGQGEYKRPKWAKN
jgi:hypothetical protein